MVRGNKSVSLGVCRVHNQLSWENFVSSKEKTRYDIKPKAGKMTIDKEDTALLIIDVTNGFIDQRFNTACPDGVEAVRNIKLLLESCRQNRLPIVFTTGNSYNVKHVGKATKRKSNSIDLTPERNEIIKEIAPKETEFILKKDKASAFFQTPLITYLVQRKISTLLIAGCTTSGCVRASVIDACSYGFNVSVIEECVFDRAEMPHAANLFDMNAKYAQVVKMSKVLEGLS